MATIQGIYNKTVFRNVKTGFTTFVFNLNSYDEDGNNVYLCKGRIPSYAPGSPLVLNGELSNEKDNIIFKVTTSDYNISEKGMLKAFIKACLPAGMGDKKADDLLLLLDKEKMTLEELINHEKALEYFALIKGFNKQNSVSFMNKVTNSLIEKDLFYSLARFGIKFGQVSKLYDRFGIKAKELIKENPYETLSLIDIPFEKIDVFAKENGTDYCDKNRIKALVNAASFSVLSCGHSFVSVDEYTDILRKTERHLSAFDAQVPIGLIGLGICENKGLKVEDDKISIKSAVNAETAITRHLNRLTKTSEGLINKDKIDAFKSRIDYLDETQKSAIDLLLDTKPCCLVGGPGTGKTTIIKKIIECFKINCPDKKYALIAPTGRAAQRIKESSGEEAFTIHMLLKYCFINGDSEPTYNEENPLDVDFLIMDESSMVGIFLFKNLLSALKDSTKLLIVGDWNQLQSVEPGSLLKDIVESEKFKTIFLTKVYRQAKDSKIVDVAHLIKDGVWNEESNEDVTVYRCKNNEEGKLLTKELFLKITNEEKNDDCIIMCPQRRGNYGVESVNSLIQGELHTTDEPFITSGNNIFFEEDRVMTTRNNYDEVYYNGDLWKLESIVGESEVLLKNKDELNVILNEETLEDLELAYAMTVHKCQGSEADTCIIFLPEGVSNSLKSRALLYTAVTRAKRKLYIINVNDSLNGFIKGVLNQERHSNLKEMIEKSL